MTYILNCWRSVLLGLLFLTGSSCSSLLNTTPAKSSAMRTASRPANQKVVARPVRVATKKAIGPPVRKVSAVTSPMVSGKTAAKQQPLANRTEVPIKGALQPARKKMIIGEAALKHD